MFRAFARSSRALFVQFDRDLQRDVGMPRTYFEILWLLHQAPGRALRMSDLAERTGSQASRITHAVGRLEQAGQVRRELCSEDRRGWFAVLTDEGLEPRCRVAAPRYAQSIRDRFLAPLSADGHGSSVTAHRRDPPRPAGLPPRIDPTTDPTLSPT